MKVLQLVQTPQRRGAEVFAYQLSNELCNQGHQVRSIYLYPYRGSGGLTLHAGDQVLDGQVTHLLEKFPGVHPFLLRRLQSVLDDFQPDVVQVNGGSTVKYGAFARRTRRRQPWVLIYRNIGAPQDWVQGWQRRFFYQRLVMPQLDGVVGVSQTTLVTVQSFYHLTVPCQAIPNGVLIEEEVTVARTVLRQRLQTGEHTLVLLAVGSLSKEKRIDRLLRVAGTVIQAVPDLQLWIVGDGPEREHLATQAAQAGIARHVHFLGVQADVAPFMAAADLFVLTSDTEGIPAVILEAGSQGLPVVATNVGGIHECIRDGITGQLVSPEDEMAIAAQVLALLQNLTRRTQMGQQAKLWVREKFAMEKIAQQYLGFYLDVLNRKKRQYQSQI